MVNKSGLACLVRIIMIFWMFHYSMQSSHSFQRSPGLFRISGFRDPFLAFFNWKSIQNPHQSDWSMQWQLIDQFCNPKRMTRWWQFFMPARLSSFLLLPSPSKRVVWCKMPKKQGDTCLEHGWEGRTTWDLPPLTHSVTPTNPGCRVLRSSWSACDHNLRYQKRHMRVTQLVVLKKSVVNHHHGYVFAFVVVVVVVKPHCLHPATLQPLAKFQRNQNKQITTVKKIAK